MKEITEDQTKTLEGSAKPKASIQQTGLDRKSASLTVRKETRDELDEHLEAIREMRPEVKVSIDSLVSKAISKLGKKDYEEVIADSLTPKNKIDIAWEKFNKTASKKLTREEFIVRGLKLH